MKGSCFCEKVSFEIATEITEIYQCHCSECRKTTGAASNAGFIISQDQLQWLSGEDNIKTFKKESGFRVCFCATCGSTVPNKTSVKDNMMWVPAGLLISNPSLKVTNHIYVGSKADWDEIGGTGHQHQTLPADINCLLS